MEDHNPEEFYPKDAVLKEEIDGIRFFIPRVAKNLSRADERLVAKAVEGVRARAEQRERQQSLNMLGSAAVDSQISEAEAL